MLKVIKVADKLVNCFISLLIIISLLYSAWAIYDVTTVYADASAHFTYGKNSKEITLSEYKAENDDVCAILKIDNTGINYPVLQGEDNAEYVNKGVDGGYVISGSIFIDCDNSNDFTDRYTLFYGHRMDNSAMFGDIAKFRETAFFKDHPYGELTLEDGMHRISFFSCIECTASEREFFDVTYINGNIEDTLSLINDKAVHSRRIELNESSKIIALSTCEGATTTGRIILFGVLEGVYL